MTGGDRARLCGIARKRSEELERLPEDVRVLLIDTDPISYAAGIAAAVSTARPLRLFLGSPHWGVRDREQVLLQVCPHMIWSDENAAATTDRPVDSLDELQVLIPTGGTTGGFKFVTHTRATLAHAANGLRAWMGGGPLSSVSFLPLFHVSGLMPLVRAWISGGTVTLASWQQIEAGAFPAVEDALKMTSIVPTQLVRLLGSPRAVAWLRQFKAVFLGGAAPWPRLLDDARTRGIPLAPCYGMSETAAQIAAVRPDSFLADGSLAAEILPHATVDIVAPDGLTAVSPGGEGRIRVRARSLFLGYWPDLPRRQDRFLTPDVGRLDERGRLHVLGRADAVINSGGEKVEPAIVEHAVRESGLVSDAAVCGVADAKWGEAVVAVLVGCSPSDEARLIARLRERLSPHQVPKRFVHVDAIPRTLAGKVDRRALTQIAAGGHFAR